MLNKHGLKIINIKKAAGATEDWNGTDLENCLYYDRTNGYVMCLHLGQNNWAEWHDPDIICIAHTPDRMTMQQIADSIAWTLQQIDGKYP